MGIVLTITWLFALTWLLPRIPLFRDSGLTPRIWQGLFLLKVCAGIALWALYTWYYTDRCTSDIFRYFDDALVVFQAIPDHPLHYLKIITGIGNDGPVFDIYYNTMNNWYKDFNHNLYNDNRTMIRLNALMMLVSQGHYHVHNVLMNFMTLSGLAALFASFKSFFAGREKLLAGVLVLIPSVLFWSSGVLKEGLVMFAMGFLFYGLHSYRAGKRPVASVLTILVMLGLMVITKVYVLIALLPGLISYAICLWLPRVRTGWVYLMVHVVMISVMANMGRWSDNYNLIATIHGKQKDFIQMLEYWDAGSAISAEELEPSFTGLLKAAPAALFTTLFRPFPWSADGALTLLAAMENILLLLIILYACRYATWPGREGWNMLLLCLSFSLIFFTVIGLTTPVIGALVRYKIPALPFWVMIFLLIIDQRKIVAKFRKSVS
ncbi:MAG: hypothetical protein KDD36_05345 [Flavobacteriales bacterium]|nr:hypothetical protein [Flavobacteriales bacterium]